MNSLLLLRHLVEQRQFELLHEACSPAAAQHPAEHVLWALACAHLGDAPAARQVLSVLDASALDLDARVDLAAVHLLLGDTDAAQALLTAALTEAPEHALLLARLAACHLQRHEPEAARHLYEQSLAQQPRILVFEHLLHLYLKNADLASAEHTLAAAEMFWAGEQAHWPDAQVALHSQQLRGLRLDLCVASEDFAAAEAWLDAQQAVLPEEPWCDLLGGYAQRLAERGRHAQAEDALRRGLQHYPAQLVLLQQLAQLATLQGRTPQAMALLRRALRLASQGQQPTVALRLKLASTATPSHPLLAREMAQQAIDEALALQSDKDIDAVQITHWQAQAQAALAGVDAQEQHYTAAEARYLAVLKDHPQLLAALQGLGSLYMQLGRIDEATALFEQVKALDPVRGHAALINARRFPDDDATLQRLEMVARRPSAEGPVQPSLLLQLAAAWEKRKDYAKAFALADEANNASRQLLSYNPQAHRQRCARIRHAYTRELYEHRPGVGHASTLPVFVLGMPRSGTTLVEQILAGHSQIHGAGELGLVPSVIAGLERWERRTGSGRHYPDVVDDLSAKVVDGIASHMLEELQGYAPEARHVVDKLPHNFENIGLIKLLFPKARIISVRRDPRDIALSNYFTDYAAKHGGMGFAYDLGWIGEQLADHNLLMHHWQQLFPGQIMEVNYEDVVADAEGQARRMLDYIGVDWEPQVLKFNELERPVKTASVWQVRQPIYTSSKAKWERYREHLAPLVRATNTKIEWQAITDMVTLPEPGLLDHGVDLYRQDRLDEAEHRFQQLRHHLPEHAAAGFMLGLIWVRKGHLSDGIAHMEKALEHCPWNAHWRSDLAQAYRLAGLLDKAAALKPAKPNEQEETMPDAEPIGTDAW